MGLLTDDKSNEEGTLVKLLRNHCNKLSILCYVLAIICCAALVTENYVDSTYFSDNALLPGLVNREFTTQPYINQVLERLKSESQSKGGKFPDQFIYNEFRNLGLHVYQHNYTLHYPFASESVIPGKNIYAILRAPRAPSTEALILSSPYRALNSIYGTTVPGIALMMALAKYFSTKNYWAKDLIFLVSDQEMVGFQAWLEAYHEVEKSPVLDYGYLEARSGPIQGAVNLEIHGEETSRLEVKIEGLNGQLPNLDLFNVAVELATRESVTPTFHGRSHPFSADFNEVTKDYALTTASMMISQAKTLPTGAHGLFHQFAIQAITLEGIGKGSTKDKESYLSVPLYQVGRVVEGIFRSLNNLLERFNRSYWFYLLPSTRRYISIGYYMIPFGLMAIPLLLKALNIYITMKKVEQDKKDQQETGSLWNALPFTFYCHVLGFLIASLPGLIQRYSFLYRDYNLKFKDTIYYTLIAMSVLSMVNPLVPIKRKLSAQQMKAHECIAIINLALILSCLSLLNISLAMFLTLFFVPITLLCVASSKAIVRNFFSLFLLLLHPLAIGYFCLLATSLWYDRDETNLMKHLNRSMINHKQSLLNYIEDWYIYGNWTFFFGSAFLFPAWLQVWYIL